MELYLHSAITPSWHGQGKLNPLCTFSKLTELRVQLVSNWGARDFYKGARDFYKGIRDFYKGARDFYKGVRDFYKGARDFYKGVLVPLELGYHRS